MKKDPKNIVKVGKKHLCEDVSLNLNSGDNETMINVRYSKPPVRGASFVVPDLPWLKKKKKRKK